MNKEKIICDIFAIMIKALFLWTIMAAFASYGICLRTVSAFVLLIIIDALLMMQLRRRQRSSKKEDQE